MNQIPETGNGTPEANGTSEPIRNARPKNGTRRYTWCIDRFDCFTARTTGTTSTVVVLISREFLSTFYSPASSFFNCVRGYNRTRYRHRQRVKIASLKNGGSTESPSIFTTERRCKFLRETWHFRTNWNPLRYTPWQMFRKCLSAFLIVRKCEPFRVTNS